MNKPVEYCEYQIKTPSGYWRHHEDQLIASDIFNSGENRSIRLKVIYADGSCRAFFDCSSVPEKILSLARKAAINSLYCFKKLYTPKETCDAIIRRGGKISYSKLSEDKMNKKDTTAKEVFDTLNDDQKKLFYIMVGKALEESNGKSESAFPGYQFARTEKPGEGGYVYSEAGPYNDLVLRDIHSILDIARKALEESVCKVGDNVLGIKKVIFNGPATIVIWADGSKTVVKCMEGDIYDQEKAIMMCVIEHLLGGSKMEVKRFFKKWVQEEDDLDSPGNLFEVVEKAVENAKKALDDLGGKK